MRSQDDGNAFLGGPPPPGPTLTMTKDFLTNTVKFILKDAPDDLDGEWTVTMTGARDEKIQDLLQSLFNQVADGSDRGNRIVAHIVGGHVRIVENLERHLRLI